MVKRAIIGIALGILFAPVIFMLLYSISMTGLFSSWLWNLFGNDFTGAIQFYATGGQASMLAPLFGHPFSSPVLPGLIDAFGPTYSLLEEWLPSYLPALVTWTMIGAWSGAIERSSGRGIGVGVGVWLGWLITGLIFLIINSLISSFLDLLMGSLLTLLTVIIIAAIFGAITRSESL